MRWRCIYILFTSLSCHAHPYLPTQAPVPGGVAFVDIPGIHQVKPKAYYLRHKTFVTNTEQQDRWLAIVGLPLSAKIGTHKLKVKTTAGYITTTFDVHNHEYPKEHLTIKNKRKVNPLPVDYDRIKKESDEILSAYATWSQKRPSTLQFTQPVKGRQSSQFGLQRILNGQKKNPHSGLDIAAIEGTPIHAPNDGVVLQTGDYFYSGKMVFLDHGQGIITSYAHMSDISVVKGQQLKTGELIGKVGKTGRVTGAHLHWSVSLNGYRVNPKLFMISQ